MARDREEHIDQVLVTGDISQDNSVASYNYCQNVVDTMDAPSAWVRGNHDEISDLDRPPFREHFPSYLKLGNWVILFANTQEPNAIHGHLSAESLDLLESQLVAFQAHPVIIALHHHPLPVGSTWMDNINLRNSHALLTLLRGYPQIQAILHGHAHQERDDLHHGIRILGTPSTCVQFAPGSHNFAVDQQQPGYRRMKLYPDGLFETEVCRLPAGTWLPDTTQSGY